MKSKNFVDPKNQSSGNKKKTFLNDYLLKTKIQIYK